MNRKRKNVYVVIKNRFTIKYSRNFNVQITYINYRRLLSLLLSLSLSSSLLLFFFFRGGRGNRFENFFFSP